MAGMAPSCPSMTYLYLDAPSTLHDSRGLQEGCHTSELMESSLNLQTAPSAAGYVQRKYMDSRASCMQALHVTHFDRQVTDSIYSLPYGRQGCASSLGHNGHEFHVPKDFRYGPMFCGCASLTRLYKSKRASQEALFVCVLMMVDQAQSWIQELLQCSHQCMLIRPDQPDKSSCFGATKVQGGQVYSVNMEENTRYNF